MKAVIFEQFGGPLELREMPDPEPAPDGVAIRVMANGICRSDWHGWMGHDPDVQLPHVPGHELAGVVEAVGGEVRRWKPGDRVTVPFACGCGQCATCLAGNQHICDRYFQPGFTGWGSFATLVAIRYADGNLVRLPDELDFVSAASLGCRFTTAFRAVVAQGRIRPGEWLAVHGCGGVGLAAVMIGAAAGARVLAVDIREEALTLARELGAEQTVHARPGMEVVEAIADLTGGGADVSLDALGSLETCRNSVACLRKRGRHVQVGLMVADYREPALPMNLVIARELEILGSHGMPAHAYGPLLDLIVRGRLQPQRLVQKKITLAESTDELPAMTRFQSLGATVIDRFD